MWSGSRGEATVPAATAMDSRREISAAWRSLKESKTALRHIENRLEAVAGTGVVLDSLISTEKTSARSSRKASHRERRGVEDVTASKPRPHSQRSPDKTSRSPLRSSTQETSSKHGDRTQAHVSHGDASPAASRRAAGAAPEWALSQLVYERDSRPLHGAELDSTRSSALDATSVHYLNDSPNLEMQPPAHRASPGSEIRPVAPTVDGQMGAPHSSVLSSPGSASVRLEKLRQRQPDGKLEKLKERIRRQREQLEETAERERLLGYLDQPVGSDAPRGPRPTLPTAPVRKVAPAPPAPVYKGFNTSETKIRTSDGKVWGEEEFRSREIYRDLTHHLKERETRKPPERDSVQEKVPKPVRKIHRRASVPSPDAKPVISTSSWREGQKLVKMMLGSAPRLPREPRAESVERDRHTGPDPQLELNCHSRVRSTERPGLHRMPVATTSSRPAGGGKRRVPAATETSRRSGDRDGSRVVEQSSHPVETNRGRLTVAQHSSKPAGGDEVKGAVAEQPATPAGGAKRRSPSRGLLSADIRGILDDLQLEGGTKGPDEGGVCRRSPARRRPAPARLSRSASPAKTRPESSENPRKRHYDTDTVRQYIARQQEDRKRKQAEERRSQREEAQRRSQRLQELYRKQREGVARAPAPPPSSVQTRLQETYTKLLLEHTLQQPRPVYQPSGESDKENKGQEPLSPSTSDLSVSELRPQLLSRAALGLGSLYSSWLHAEHQNPVAPHAGHLLTLQPEEDASQRGNTSAIHTAPSEPVGQLHAALQVSRMERVEALKAQAASLSSRVEGEARRLTRASVTPSAAPGLPVNDDVLWAKPTSPPEREGPGAALRAQLGVQRLLRAGQSAFGELPGVGNLSSFCTQDRKENVVKPHPAPTGPSLLPGEWAEPLDSSGGSISEGLLTDSSMSDGEDAPDDPANVQTAHAKAIVDYCSSLHTSLAHNPITAFKRDAEQLAPYRPVAALQDCRSPWEELSKGSTHSVINIFTKNLHNYKKVVELDEAGIAPHSTALPAGNTVMGTAYADDFISSRTSSQSASKRTANSLSNGHNGGPDERRESISAHSSPRSAHSSPCSAHSSPRSIDRTEKSLERTLVEGNMSTSLVSDLQWDGVRKRDSENSSASGSHRGTDTDCTLGGASVHSVHSLPSEGQPFPRSPAARPGSPADFLSPPSSAARSDTPCSSLSSPSGAKGSNHSPLPAPGPAHTAVPAAARGSPMHFAPGVLHQRLSAELSYLSAVEESVRQLGDVERVRAVSLAQQESVSLAQILKAQQERQERDTQLLKMKADQEALEAQRVLQERTTQMTELARSQLLSLPSVTPLYDQQRQLRTQTDSTRDVAPSRMETVETPQDCPPESNTSRRPTTSGGDSVSARRSPSPTSSVKEGGGATGSGDCRERSSLSVEEEVHTAVDDSLHTDSIHSLLEDRADSASVATEYSVRFEESVTEDELEKSFRSLLPSESHWRDSVERGRSPLPESDEERSRDKSSSQLSTKDSSLAFSGGQDSFSKFTMAMVRQYMQEEEVRAQHQGALLHLRHRALKEKTKAELAWLEHQKRRLRDKGEDDKMPPLRKRQRGLLLRLQQEQAEIRRLQEVSRAARRERQLLLKQQEEIELMQHTTLRLRRKLRSAGDTSPRSPVSGEIEELAPPSVAVTDVETRSPSPISVSGSETSSIMQKLKKMRYHTDERFLTQREQQLVRRRLQVEELLAWRQRLDEEEVAVQEMEMQALAAWEPPCKPTGAGVQPEHSTHSLQACTDPGSSPRTRQDAAVGRGGEDESSPALSVSSVHTGPWAYSSDGPLSKHLPVCTHGPQEPESTHSNRANCTVSSSNNLHVHSSSRISESCPPAAVSEAASDQSDVEGRVLALKEELRRRKAEVQRLKREQKQRQKERLKAQEASLLRQLESYNTFIQKTKAELSRADSTPAAKPQIKTPAPSRDKLRIKAPGLCRPEASRNLGTVSESERTETLLTESPAESECHEDVVCTVTPTPVLGSPERASLLDLEPQHSPSTHSARSQSESSARPLASASSSSDRSEVIEELDFKSEGLSDEQDWSRPAQLRLDLQPARGVERIATPEPHALTDVCLHQAADSVNRGAEGDSSASVLNTDVPRAPDCSSHPDLSPRKDWDEQIETPSPAAHGYNDDFESSLGSSVMEEHQSSTLTSPLSAQQKPFLLSSGEEVDDELGVQSGTGRGSSPSPWGSLPEPSREVTTRDTAVPPTLLTSLPSAEGSPGTPKDAMPSYCVGDRVLVNNIQPGTLRFKGQTSFSSGFWAGVELDRSEGTNDGVCEGVVYFQCKEGHGIFAPPEQISHLPEKVGSHADNTADEDSSFDDHSHKMLEKLKMSPEDDSQQSTLQNKKPDPCFWSEARESSDRSTELDTKLTKSGNDNFLKSTPDINVFNCNIMEDVKQRELTVANGRPKDIVLKFEDLSNGQQDLPLNREKETSKVQRQEEEPTVDIFDLLVSGEKTREKDKKDSCEKMSVVDGVVSSGRSLSTLVDRILDSFMCDTVRQFQQIRQVKEEKIIAANQQKVVNGEAVLGGNSVSQLRLATANTDNFHALFDKDQEEPSSPELCTRSESPVLGPSGQEELAKRLAELELNRELLEVLGDEQDWFDEDFGLSSRKEQQKLKRRRPEHEEVVPAPQQARAPARPQPPQGTQPGAPPMLVPHAAPEVEKLVSAALQEIWRGCGLGQGQLSVAGVPKPQPSEAFLHDSSSRDDQEAHCLRSYKQAVFDLSWEVIQDMYVEDPKSEQPQWARPRRVSSACIHRVISPNDLSKVQAFVTSEVLKLYGLKKGQSHKSDWQKMLKFGRKKRDRVDHILVQELHEEEALWVNYDEDELFVKMQLADGIFDALLKDTAEVLIHIQEKLSKRTLC